MSMKMTHLGDQETTIRSSLLVVFGNEVVRRSTWNRSSVSGQRGHDYTVLELKLSDVPWCEERVAAGGVVGHCE